LLPQNQRKQTRCFETNRGLQIVGIAMIAIAGLFGLLLIVQYWRADYLYARAQEAQQVKITPQA